MVTKNLRLPLICRCGNKWKKGFLVQGEKCGMGFFLKATDLDMVIKGANVVCPKCLSKHIKLDWKDFYRERQ